MIFRLKQAVNLVILTVMTVTFAGCVKQDAKECPRSAFMRFAYTHNSSNTDKFQEQVRSLTILIYDNNGKFLDERHMTCEELEGGNRYALDLEPGKYKIVTWGNYNDKFYDLTSEEDISTMRLSLLRNNDNSVSESCSLFHGYSEIEITKNKNVEILVPLIKNTSLIRIVLENENSNTRVCLDTDFCVRISGINTIYTYDNNMADESESCPAIYLPSYEQESDNSYLADFYIQRMFVDNDKLKLTIQDINYPEELIYDIWLTEEILNTVPEISTDSDLDKHDEITIRFNLKLSGSAWTVSAIYINDWEYIPDSMGGI